MCDNHGKLFEPRVQIVGHTGASCPLFQTSLQPKIEKSTFSYLKDTRVLFELCSKNNSLHQEKRA